MRTVRLLAVAAIVAACDGLPASNPFDPNAPDGVAAKGALTGRLVLDDTGTPDATLAAQLGDVSVSLRTSAGAPVTDQSGGTLVATLTIDGHFATFQFPELKPDRYRTVVEGVGKRFVAPVIPLIDVRSGETSELGDLTFVAIARGDIGPGSISGEVLLPGAVGGPRIVRLYVVEGGVPRFVKSTTTSDSGEFSLIGLEAGTYAVTGELEGFSPDYAVDVTLGDGEGETMSAELRSTAALRLYQVSAVVQPQLGPDVGFDHGGWYVAGDSVPLQVLRFGGEETGAFEGPVQMRLSTDRTFGQGGTEVAFEDYSATKRFTLPSTEGAIDVFAQFHVKTTSGFEFFSPVFSTTVIRDVSKPRILSGSLAGLTAAADGNTYVTHAGSTVTLALDATDDQSAIAEVWMDQPGGTSAPAPDTVPFDETNSPAGLVRLTDGIGLTAGDGPKRVFAYVKDRAGNVSDPFELDVIVDSAAPAIATARLNGGAAFATSPVVTLEVTLPSDAGVTELATSTEQGFAVEAWVPFTASSTVLLAPGDGARSMWVKVRDAAGNESVAVEAPITVDTQAPTFPALVLASGATVTKSAAIAVALSATGATKARLSVDGTFDGSAPAETFAATFPTSVTLPTGDGRKVVWAQFADDAGNATQTVSSSITLDTAAPTFGAGGVSIDAGAAFARSVSVSATVDGAGAAQMAIATDGTVDTETFFTYAATTTVLLPSGDCAANAAGCKSVCVKLRDDAGNTSAQSCDTITLDTTAPSVPILATQDSVVNTTTFAFNLAAQPTESFFARYEVFVQGRDTDFVAQSNVQSNLAFQATLATPPSSGSLFGRKSTNLIRIRAVDLAGNVSAESSLTVVVDREAPATPVLAGTPAVINADTVQVNFAATNTADDDATFDHYEVRAPPLVPAFTPTASVDSLLFTLTPDATTTIEVKAVDAAGNASGIATATVREDSTEPSAPEITPTTGTVRGTSIEVNVATASLDNGSRVTTYQLKGGAGSNYADVVGEGPFLVSLRTNRENEICIRGKDAAGNVSLEDCATITEASSGPVVANGIDVSGHDVYGDYVAYGSRGGVFLHDMRYGNALTLADETQLTSFSGDFDNVPGAEANYQPDSGQLPRMSGDLRYLRVVVSGNSRTNFILYGLDPSLGDIDTVAGGIQSRAERQFMGTSADIHGTRISFVANNQVRWRAVDTLGPIAVNTADFGTAVSNANVTVCPGTIPRIFDATIVWCEWTDDGDNVAEVGEGRVYKRVVSPQGAIEQLSSRLAVVRSGSLMGGGGVFQQPQITDRYIFWAETPVTGSTQLKVFTGGIANAFTSTAVSTVPAFTDPACGTMGFDDLTDASGPRAVFGFVRSEGLTSDTAVYDFQSNTVRCVTNDMPPQSVGRIDANRVIWKDNSVGESLFLSDLTSVRWLDASPELAFEPVTSYAATVWIATRTDAANPTAKRAALLARRVPFDPVTTSGRVVQPIVELDSQMVFGGSSEADPPYAAGGNVVAWLRGTVAQWSAGTALPLLMRDLSTNTTVTLNSVKRIFALDPDGTTVAFVDQNGALRTASTATAALGGIIESGVGTNAVFVDVDGPMVVYQKGGAIDDRRSTGTAYLSNNGAAGVNLGLGDNQIRAPRVARVGAEYYVAYMRDDDAGVGVQLVPHVCKVQFTPVGCTGDQAIGIGFQNVDDISLSRDGYVVWKNDETGIDEIALWDVRAKRRVFVTPTDLAVGDRASPSIAEGRLVWYDAALGNLDIWEMSLPR